MGLLGNNQNQNQMYSLLGIDPSAMRRQALWNGLAAAGFQLMGDKNLGNAGGAFLQGTNQARDDYYRTALDAYRLKTDAEERAENRDWRQKEWDYKTGLADETRERNAEIDRQNAWRFGQEQETAELAESQRLGQQSSVNKFAGRVDDWRQQGGDLFDTGMQTWLRGQGVSGVDPTQPRVTPQDYQRYNKMQPHMQAQDYGEAFDILTDGANKDAEYGLNPIIIQNPQTGEYMLLQPSKDGSPPRQVPLPPGYQYAPPTRALDTGTGYVTQPTRGTGQTGEFIPKDLRGAEQQKALGQTEGEGMAAAPADIAAADLALSKINDLRSDPNRTWGTGVSSLFNVIPGTPGYDYQTKVDEVTAGAFLTAIQQMRGLGQLSNAEGKTATAAVTRMKTATSEGAFLEALADYENVVLLARERAARKLPADRQPPPPQSGGASQQQDPLGLR
jgi:hypothetical protein